MSFVIDLTTAESEDEIRCYLQGLGIYGVNPWLVRLVEVHDDYAWVTSAVADDRGRPTFRRHTTRHERQGIAP